MIWPYGRIASGFAEGLIRDGWDGALDGATSGAESGAIFGLARGTISGLRNPYICFVAGTPVLTAGGREKIEKLRVGQRVLTEGTKDAAVAESSQVHPETWRLIRLRLVRANGSVFEAEMLRPLAWIEQTKATVGGTVALSLPEINVEGQAEVLAIEPCPEVQTGRGRVITATFTQSAAEVMEVRLSSGDIIGTTPPHPFWSEDRQDWIAAGELNVGEHLRSRDGQKVTVASVRSTRTVQRVYNLEVETEHQYYVSEADVLVHNEYGRRGSPQTRQHLETVRDDFLANNPGFAHVAGGRDRITGVEIPEEFIRGATGKRKGGAWADLTFEHSQTKTRVRVNTVDTYATGNMTRRESANYQRILSLTKEPAIVVPKP